MILVVRQEASQQVQASIRKLHIGRNGNLEAHDVVVKLRAKAETSVYLSLILDVVPDEQ